MVLSHFKEVTHRKSCEGKYGCWWTGSGLHFLAQLGLRPQSGSGWAGLPSSEPPGAPGALPAVLSPTGGPVSLQAPVRPAAAAQTALCPTPTPESSAPPAHWGPRALAPRVERGASIRGGGAQKRNGAVGSGCACPAEGADPSDRWSALGVGSMGRLPGELGRDP